MRSSSNIDVWIADLRQRFSRLGKRIEQGDETELLIWIIPSTFACCHRPLRHNQLYGGSARNLDRSATPLIFDWARRVRSEGIQSIICLMSSEELAFYSRLDLDADNLLAFYEKQGFTAVSIPWKDPAHVRRDFAALRKKEIEVSTDALQAFDALPKPVLLHCSAGIDRSSPVAAYIWQQRAKHLA